MRATNANATRVERLRRCSCKTTSKASSETCATRILSLFATPKREVGCSRRITRHISSRNFQRWRAAVAKLTVRVKCERDGRTQKGHQDNDGQARKATPNQANGVSGRATRRQWLDRLPVVCPTLAPTGSDRKHLKHIPRHAFFFLQEQMRGRHNNVFLFKCMIKGVCCLCLSPRFSKQRYSGQRNQARQNHSYSGDEFHVFCPWVGKLTASLHFLGSNTRNSR